MQTMQLARLLAEEGVDVQLVPVRAATVTANSDSTGSTATTVTATAAAAVARTLMPTTNFALAVPDAHSVPCQFRLKVLVLSF